MPRLSNRSQEVPLSPFRKLIPFADAAKEKGRHVYHLNIGQPDILTPPAAISNFKHQLPEILAYSPAEGHWSYREKLTDYYQRFDIALETEEIIVTTGGSEAILFFMLSCFDPGDEVIIPEPFYANYNGFAQMAGVKVVPVTCRIEDGFALPPISAFAEKITAKTKAIIITNPNNPTGCAYTKEALEELAKLVRKHDLFLCSDEVYREFCYDGAAFYSVLNLNKIKHQTVVIDSVSKRYSSCGARVGTLVTRNENLLAAVSKYAKLRLSPPGLGQMLAEEMLEDDSTYLSEAKAEYANRRAVVYERLQAIPGVVSYKPGGAFYCFAKMPITDAEDFCRWLLEDFSHNNATVMLSPGQGFYATPGLGTQEVRIAYVLNEKDLHAAMDCLETALQLYSEINKPKEVQLN